MATLTPAGARRDTAQPPAPTGIMLVDDHAIVRQGLR